MNGEDVMAHILVVDDDQDIRKLVETILTKRGHKVSQAEDGESGLGFAMVKKPDLVILDLHLPKMDGFEVCRRLKADQATRRIPVIMLTAAYPEWEDAQKGFKLGADEYVIKPFAAELLVHNIERLLKTSSE
jgi:DNA-binding response OmpR family regulator